jgi:hypothetical protein
MPTMRKRRVSSVSLLLGILLLGYAIRQHPQEPCPPRDTQLEYMVKMRFHVANTNEKSDNDFDLLRKNLLVAICMVICNKKDCGFYTVFGELPSRAETRTYYYEVEVPQQSEATSNSIIKQCEGVIALYFSSHLQIVACSVSFDPVRYEVDNEE